MRRKMATWETALVLILSAVMLASLPLSAWAAEELAVVAAGGAVLVGVQELYSTWKAGEHLSRAHRFVEFGNWEPAFKELQAAKYYEPESMVVHSLLRQVSRSLADQYMDRGELYLAEGALDKALQAFHYARFVDPGHPEVDLAITKGREALLEEWYNRGLKAFELGNWKEAAETLRAVVEADPAYRDVRGRYQEAYDKYRLEVLQEAAILPFRSQPHVSEHSAVHLAEVLEREIRRRNPEFLSLVNMGPVRSVSLQHSLTDYRTPEEYYRALGDELGVDKLLVGMVLGTDFDISLAEKETEERIYKDGAYLTVPVVKEVLRTEAGIELELSVVDAKTGQVEERFTASGRRTRSDELGSYTPHADEDSTVDVGDLVEIIGNTTEFLSALFVLEGTSPRLRIIEETIEEASAELADQVVAKFDSPRRLRRLTLSSSFTGEEEPQFPGIQDKRIFSLHVAYHPWLLEEVASYSHGQPWAFGMGLDIPVSYPPYENLAYAVANIAAEVAPRGSNSRQYWQFAVGWGIRYPLGGGLWLEPDLTAFYYQLHDLDLGSTATAGGGSTGLGCALSAQLYWGGLWIQGRYQVHEGSYFHVHTTEEESAGDYIRYPPKGAFSLAVGYSF